MKENMVNQEEEPQVNENQEEKVNTITYWNGSEFKIYTPMGPNIHRFWWAPFCEEPQGLIGLVPEGA